MRKIKYLLLGVVLAVNLTACSSKDSGDAA